MAKIACSNCKKPSDHAETEKGVWKCDKCNYIILGHLEKDEKYAMVNCACGYQEFQSTNDDRVLVSCTYCNLEDVIYHIYPGDLLAMVRKPPNMELEPLMKVTINGHPIYETIRADPCVDLVTWDREKDAFKNPLTASRDGSAGYMFCSVNDTSSGLARRILGLPKSLLPVLVPCHGLYIVPIYGPTYETLPYVKSPCCDQEFHADWKRFVGTTYGRDIVLGKSKEPFPDPPCTLKMPPKVGLSSWLCTKARRRDPSELEAENDALKVLTQEAFERYNFNFITKRRHAESLKELHRNLFESQSAAQILKTAVYQLNHAAVLEKEVLWLRGELERFGLKKLIFRDQPDYTDVNNLRNLHGLRKTFARELLTTYRRLYPDELYESHYKLMRRIFHEDLPHRNPAEIPQVNQWEFEEGPSDDRSMGCSPQKELNGAGCRELDDGQMPGTSKQAEAKSLLRDLLGPAASPQKQNGAGCKKKEELGDGQKSESQAGVPAEIPQVDKRDFEQGPSDPLSAGPSQQKKLNGAGCKKKGELDDGQTPGTSRQAELLKEPVLENAPSPQKKQNGSGGKTKGKRSNGQTSRNQPAVVPAEIPQMDSNQKLPEDLSVAASGGGHGTSADDGQTNGTSGQERAQVLNQPTQEQGPSPRKEQNGSGRKKKGKRSNGQTPATEQEGIPLMNLDKKPHQDPST